MPKLRPKGFDDEIAEKLGVSTRTAATDIYRAKEQEMAVPPSPYRTARKRRSS